MFHIDYQFNKYHYCTHETAMQYDSGQKLLVNNLPNNCEAHWVYKGLPDDVDVDIRKFEDNICKIPDLAFLYDTTVTCYIFYRTESKVETIAEITLPIKSRPKPENYIVSDDVPRIENVIDAAIRKIDYEKLSNKPSINDIELSGNKSLGDLSIQEEMEEFSNADILKLWNEH